MIPIFQNYMVSINIQRKMTKFNHIKKAKDISEFIAELFFEWKGYFVSILPLVSKLCVNVSHSVFVFKYMCECL